MLSNDVATSPSTRESAEGEKSSGAFWGTSGDRRAAHSGVEVLPDTGLRESTAAQVSQRQQHDVEPRLVGAKVVAVPIGRLHEERRHENADDRRDVGEQLGGLERRLGLRGVATLRALDVRAVGALVNATDGRIGRGRAGESHAVTPRGIEGALPSADASEGGKVG